MWWETTGIKNNLITLSQLYDVSFIPIDSPRRDYWIEALNKKFNLSLTTNWRPLNSIGEYVTTTPEELRKATDELLSTEEAFFNKYY